MPARMKAARRLLPSIIAAILAAACATGRLKAGEAEARAAFERGLKLFDDASAFATEKPSEWEEASRRFRAAAAAFVDAWKAGAATSEVFTNAGNCFAFAGLTGEAVLFYRRALAVDPANKRAADALEKLRQGLPIRKPAGGAGSSIVRSLFFWHEGVSFRARQALFLVLFPLAFVCFAAALFRRRPFFTLGAVCLLPGLVLLASVSLDALGGSLRDDGVILVEVEGRDGDGPMYSSSHSKPLPSGTEVAIQPIEGRAATGEWLHVKLLDGTDSWVPAMTVARVLE